MQKIQVWKQDEVFLVVEAERGTLKELSEYFTFRVPGYQFMPAYREKIWDGKIRLFNMTNQTLYVGLLNYLKKFSKDFGYTLEVVGEGLEEYNEEPSLEYLKKFFKKIYLTKKPRDYQIAAFLQAISKKRTIILSPTASGKSLICFLIWRWLFEEIHPKKTLIVVPKTSLVEQMAGDFEEYVSSTASAAYQPVHFIEKIYSGVKPHFGQGGVMKNGKLVKNGENNMVVISTWQSIYKKPKEWFDQFGLIVGDEAHTFQAKSLRGIMEKLTDCEYRIGMSGTLQDAKTHQLVLEGLFGPVFVAATTDELIQKGHISKLSVVGILLKYPEETCKRMVRQPYQKEIDFLVQHKGRNRFIQQLVSHLKGNTLVLFTFKNKHGKGLFRDIQKKDGKKRKVFYVDGNVATENREKIREITEKEKDAIIVASYGTFSTGINIVNLHNIIFASPVKSKIRNLQSIGRSLRKSAQKTKATLYDIGDDLRYKKYRQNFSLDHFSHRVKIYIEENFQYKIYKRNLK